MDETCQLEQEDDEKCHDNMLAGREKIKLILMKHCYCPEHENPKDNKFISTQVVTMLIWVAETMK